MMSHLLARCLWKNSRDDDRGTLINSDRQISYDSTEPWSAPAVCAVSTAADDIPYDLSNSENAGSCGLIELSHTCEDLRLENLAKCWQLNYHEAAIFIEEGQNNDKLDFHPRSREALPAYLLVHNSLFYFLDLLSAVVLMALALLEKPALPGLEVSIPLHVSVELLALCVVAVELCMKLRWMGVKPFFLHQRTVFKLMVLSIMFLEALIVAARQTTHVRILRALRPIFLIDNHYLGGVRRLIRQILQSLPPVMDMLIILFFFMSLFAILGYHIFTHVDSAPYFDSFYDSFVNLFVLLTTSNFPDIMLPYYAHSRWAALFFIVFLLVHLYFLMNLLLAVVYERFSALEKEKFRKLLLHRRKACRQAFRLLVNRASPSCLYFTHFEGLMKYLKPRAGRQDVYLMFKTMDTDKKGFLSQDDFLQVYGASTLTWERQWSDSPWFCELKRPFERKLFEGAYKLATWKWSHAIVYTVIAASFAWHIIEAAEMSGGDTSFFGSEGNGLSSWVLTGLLAFYVLEMLLKMAAFGVNDYFHHYWNKFDFIVIVATIVVGCIGSLLGLTLLRIIVLRSLRLLKLFKLKKRYHDVLGTVFILMPRFISVGLVLIIVYYFFAIIGIELFSGYRMENCCKNTTVEIYYKIGNDSAGPGYYHLTNFRNLANSYVTLFALMAVNNWFIIMDGYAAVATEFSRLFFMAFYLITMIVLQIVVAFVLEAFIFRIQYKIKTGDKQEDNLVKVEMRLSKAEMVFCAKPRGSSMPELLAYPSDGERDTLCYRGIHWRTKFSFCLQMYAEEVKEWLDHAEFEERSAAEWVLLNAHTSDSIATPWPEDTTTIRRTFTL